MSAPASLRRTVQGALHDLEQPARGGDRLDQVSQTMTQGEVCAYLGISDECWRRWRKAGRTPERLDLPGHPRWRRADIEALVNGRTPSGRNHFGRVRQLRDKQSVTR